mgnify:CR=1 FL=1
MSKFRGSARSSGFDAINVPDNARRVQEAGQQRIEELRRTYKRTIDNQKGAAADLQESYSQTRTALDRNISLQNTYQQTYEKALRDRYQQKIDKSNEQAKLERDRYDRLSSFSKEAGKLGKQLYEEHKDNRQRMGMALVFKTKLTAEELQTLRRGEDELQAEHAASNAIIERLKARGASASEIKQIQELDGWILYGAEKELARKGSDAYRVHLQNPEVRNKQHDLGDGRKLSLQQALEEGKDVDYQTIRGIISSNFLAIYLGILGFFGSCSLGLVINPSWSISPFIWVFVLVPIIDLVLPYLNKDDVELKENVLHNFSILIILPCILFLIIFGLIVVSSASINLLTAAALGAAVGMSGGSIGITTAHELIHRKNKFLSQKFREIFLNLYLYLIINI